MIAAVLVVCAFALVLAAMVSFVVRSAISTESVDHADAVEVESWHGPQGSVVLRRLAGGGGVTFRNRFPAAPSSITLSVNSASGGFAGTPSTGYADRDGFGFFSYQSLAGAATAYWFGSYTAIA